MRRLVDQIDRLMDGPNVVSNIDGLKVARLELGHLYLKEKSYWQQRSQIQCLKDGDMNTQFFHVRATQRN